MQYNRLEGLGVEVDEEKCTGCGTCANTCSPGLITIENGKARMPAHCWGCGRCAKDCPQGTIRLKLDNPHFLENAIKNLESDKEIRTDIILTLGRIGDAKAIPYLLGFLKSDLWQERSASAEALGEMKGAGEVVDALIELLGDGHDTVHWQAAWALGEIGDKKAVGPLLKQIEDKDPRRCWHAVWALGKTGDKSVVNSLIALLKTRQEKIVRRHAVMALNHLNDPSALDILKECMKDQDHQTRYYAQEAVQSIESSS